MAVTAAQASRQAITVCDSPYFTGKVGVYIPPTVVDSTAPTISASPVGGSTLANSASVTLDVADNQAAPALVVISVTVAGRTETIYAGGAFLAPYTGSSVSSITKGFRFVVLRTGGWPNAAPVLRVTVVDAAGNSTSTTFTYTVSDPTDAQAPTVSLIVPPAGTTLSPSSSVSFRITDETGLLFTAVQVDQGGRRETVFDGFDILAPYIGSTRTVVSAKIVDYFVTRTGGWVSGPTFHAVAVDANGNLLS